MELCYRTATIFRRKLLEQILKVKLRFFDTRLTTITKQNTHNAITHCAVFMKWVILVQLFVRFFGKVLMWRDLYEAEKKVININQILEYNRVVISQQ